MARVIGRLRREAGSRLFRGRVRLGIGEQLGTISPEDLADIRRRFPLAKFFVLGHARSGTSFLGRLIRLHPRVHCEWQTQFFSDRGPIPYFTSPSFRHWLRHPSNKWVAGWDPTPALLRVCLDTILEREARRVGKDIVGDKSPNENGATAVHWLAALYPEARVIYIVRDGRDTILSKRVQAFIDQPDSLGRADRRMRQAFLADPRGFSGGRRSMFSSGWLENAARGWSESVSGSVAAGKELYRDRFETVRYEDLLQDPLAPLRRLWAFLGAEPDLPSLEAAVRQHAHENPEAEWHQSSGPETVRQLPRGVKGGWRDFFTPEDAARFERAAHDTLAAFGYLQPE